MDRKIIDLYDVSTHGGMDRRDFLSRLTALAGGSTAAAAMLAALHSNPTLAAVIPADDGRLNTSRADFGPAVPPWSGYLARLKGEEGRPAVIVVHENRGLNPHIRDVTRRFAVEGFLALAPDLLSPRGGTSADEDAARALIRDVKSEESLTGLVAATEFLAHHGVSSGRVGAVGFCWGGGMVNRLAASGASVRACVAYYGGQLPVEEVPRLHAPLLLHYASLDERINAGIEPFVVALKAHEKPFEMHMYEGVHHAFNNDSSVARYNREAAELAWGTHPGVFEKAPDVMNPLSSMKTPPHPKGAPLRSRAAEGITGSPWLSARAGRC